MATRLRKLATEPDLARSQLSSVLAADPALAGLVISRASIVAQQPIGTLTEAMEVLGLEELTSISLDVELGRGAVVSGPLAPMRRDAWRCALLSARLAQELAPARGIAPDEAYLAGLLHDFGAVVVIATIEDIGREQTLPTMPQTAWTALVEKLHVEFGRVTAVRWGLPTALVNLIERHHKPVTPLAHLIHLVDRVIAALDRAPASGVTALLGILELTPDERAMIAVVIPQVVQQMSSFAPPTSKFMPGALPSILDGEAAWPIDVPVTTRSATYRSLTLSPSSIVFIGTDPVELNWLVEITIRCQPGPIKVLANIKRCELMRNGRYQIVAQPYAMGGEAKIAWLAFVTTTRNLGEEDAPTLIQSLAR